MAEENLHLNDYLNRLERISTQSNNKFLIDSDYLLNAMPMYEIGGKPYTLHQFIRARRDKDISTTEIRVRKKLLRGYTSERAGVLSLENPSHSVLPRRHYDEIRNDFKVLAPYSKLLSTEGTVPSLIIDTAESTLAMFEFSEPPTVTKFSISVKTVLEDFKFGSRKVTYSPEYKVFNASSSVYTICIRLLNILDAALEGDHEEVLGYNNDEEGASTVEKITVTSAHLISFLNTYAQIANTHFYGASGPMGQVGRLKSILDHRANHVNKDTLANLIMTGYNSIGDVFNTYNLFTVPVNPFFKHSCTVFSQTDIRFNVKDLKERHNADARFYVTAALINELSKSMVLIVPNSEVKRSVAAVYIKKTNPLPLFFKPSKVDYVADGDPDTINHVVEFFNKSLEALGHGPQRTYFRYPKIPSYKRALFELKPTSSAGLIIVGKHRDTLPAEMAACDRFYDYLKKHLTINLEDVAPYFVRKVKEQTDMMNPDTPPTHNWSNAARALESYIDDKPIHLPEEVLQGLATSKCVPKFEVYPLEKKGLKERNIYATNTFYYLPLQLLMNQLADNFSSHLDFDTPVGLRSPIMTLSKYVHNTNNLDAIKNGFDSYRAIRSSRLEFKYIEKKNPFLHEGASKYERNLNETTHLMRPRCYVYSDNIYMAVHHTIIPGDSSQEVKEQYHWYSLDGKAMEGSHTTLSIMITTIAALKAVYGVVFEPNHLKNFLEKIHNKTIVYEDCLRLSYFAYYKVEHKGIRKPDIRNDYEQAEWDNSRQRIAEIMEEFKTAVSKLDQDSEYYEKNLEKLIERKEDAISKQNKRVAHLYRGPKTHFANIAAGTVIMADKKPVTKGYQVNNKQPIDSVYIGWILCASLSCARGNGVLGDSIFRIPGLVSGSAVTYQANTILMLLVAKQALTHFSVQDILNNIEEKELLVPAFFESAALSLGVGLTNELRTSGAECWLGYNTYDLKVPKLFRADLLGYDIIATDSDSGGTILPVLNKDRLYRTLAFSKVSVKREFLELNEEQATRLTQILEILKLRTLQMVGGWAYPEVSYAIGALTNVNIQDSKDINGDKAMLGSFEAHQVARMMDPSGEITANNDYFTSVLSSFTSTDIYELPTMTDVLAINGGDSALMDMRIDPSGIVNLYSKILPEIALLAEEEEKITSHEALDELEEFIDSQDLKEIVDLTMRGLGRLNNMERIDPFSSGINSQVHKRQTVSINELKRATPFLFKIADQVNLEMQAERHEHYITLDWSFVKNSYHFIRWYTLPFKVRISLLKRRFLQLANDIKDPNLLINQAVIHCWFVLNEKDIFKNRDMLLNSNIIFIPPGSNPDEFENEPIQELKAEDPFGYPKERVYEGLPINWQSYRNTGEFLKRAIGRLRAEQIKAKKEARQKRILRKDIVGEGEVTMIDLG